MAPQHEPFEPTQAMLISTGFRGNYNAGAVARNIAFAAWLEELYDAVWDAGIKILIDYRPGGVNGSYTLPDSAWIYAEPTAALGHRILCSQAIMSLVKSPVGWVKTQISNAMAFGSSESED